MQLLGRLFKSRMLNYHNLKRDFFSALLKGEGLGVGLLFYNKYSGVCRYSLHTSSEAKLLGCGSLN